MNYSVTIHAKDFSKELLAKCGMGDSLVDVLAKACKQWSQDEMEENNMELTDSAVDYVIRHFNFEEAYLQKLNREVEVAKGAMLHGAYLKLEHREQFDEDVKEFKEKQLDIASDCLGDYLGREGLDHDLAKELEEAYNSQEEENFKVWLKGDYRDYNGISGEIMGRSGLNFPDSECILNVKDCYDKAVFIFEENDALQMVEDHDGIEDRKKVPMTVLKKALIYRISSNAEATVHDEEVRRNAWKAERDRVHAYQESQRKTAEEAETARLKAMIKS